VTSDLTVIRSAVWDDALAIARIHVAGWQSSYRGIFSDNDLATISLDQRHGLWRQNLQQERCLLFVADHPHRGLVGFAYAGPNRGLYAKYQGEIIALYVLDEFQGQGIGRQLFHRAAQALRAAGYEGLIVWALKENAHRRFYERLQGKLLGEAPTSVGGGTLLQVAYGWEQPPPSAARLKTSKPSV